MDVILKFSEIILPSLVGGGLALIGVLVTNSSNKDKIINDVDKKNTDMINQFKEENVKAINEVKTEMKVHQTKTDTVIEELTREVREHNNFARRMPVLEKGMEDLEEKVNYFHKV